MKTLKKELKDKKGAWVEFLLKVLWSYKTMTQTPTRETPLSLVFGFEAVNPVEIDLISFRVKHYNYEMNEEGIKLSLNLLQEKRDDAQAIMAAYQQRTAKSFNKKVKARQFKVGD
jgi:hypothetical protein